MSCNADIIVCGNCITVALVLVQANFEDIGRGEGGHKRHSGVWAHRFQENYGPLELQYKALTTVISPWLFIKPSFILKCIHKKLLVYTTRRLRFNVISYIYSMLENGQLLLLRIILE